jgi:hypothetical protein
MVRPQYRTRPSLLLSVSVVTTFNRLTGLRRERAVKGRVWDARPLERVGVDASLMSWVEYKNESYALSRVQ